MPLDDARWRRGFYRWVARCRHESGCGASAWRCLFLSVWED